MNEKVRIITDSGCDISPEAEKEWAKYLVVMPFAVTINLSLIHISEPTRR